MLPYPLSRLCSGANFLALPHHLRALLASKMPQATLHAGTPPRSLAHERIVAVGDYTTLTLLKSGIKPYVAIIDCAVMRRRVKCGDKLDDYKIIKTENSRSTISCKAARIVCETVRRGHTLVIVDGEEDLLALPAILCSDLGVKVVYGLPGRGMIIADVSSSSKRLVEWVLSNFERVRLEGRGV